MSVALDEDMREGEVVRSVDPTRACLGIDRDALRDLMADLYRPKQAIYWLDLLASVAMGYAAFALLPVGDPWTLTGALLYCVAVLALYRAVIFTHELSHKPLNRFRAFRFAWDFLCGVPILLPSYFYDEHKSHHAQRTYGTERDGEYLSYPRLPIGYTLMLFAISPLVLPALVFRFVVLAPLMLIFPGIRGLVLVHASSLVIDSAHRRAVPQTAMPRRWVVQEIACFAWCVFIATGFAGGLISASRLVEAEWVVSGVFAVNAFRTLLAHKYAEARRGVGFHEQVLDSNDFPAPLGVLWAPVGLRYHAVHHLLPNLPYHALGTAHRRLMATIPADSPFHGCQQASLLSGIRVAIELRRRFP